MVEKGVALERLRFLKLLQIFFEPFIAERTLTISAADGNAVRDRLLYGFGLFRMLLHFRNLCLQLFKLVQVLACGKAVGLCHDQKRHGKQKHQDPAGCWASSHPIPGAAAAAWSMAGWARDSIMICRSNASFFTR